MINVVKAIIKKDNKFLLLKRSSNSKFFASLWDFPGGKIKGEEKVSEALVREVKEESNLNIKSTDKFDEYNYNEKGHEIHFRVFWPTSFSGEVKLSKDHTEFRWFSKEDLKKYSLAPIVKLALNP